MLERFWHYHICFIWLVMRDYKDYLKSLIFGVIVALIAYFINFSYGNGVLLGLLFGLVHYGLMDIVLSKLLSNKSFNGMLFAIYFLGNLVIIALAFYLCIVFKQYFNSVCCAIGLLVHNVYIYINEFFIYQKRKRKEE